MGKVVADLNLDIPTAAAEQTKNFSIIMSYEKGGMGYHIRTDALSRQRGLLKCHVANLAHLTNQPTLSIFG